MAILRIRTYPDPILRADCAPAVPGAPEIRALAEDMLETMHAAPGIGLAAPQVGKSIRLITVDVSAQLGEPAPYVMLNPELVCAEGAIAFEEGCLSLPEMSVEVQRADMVRVRYQDVEGRAHEVEARDLFAVAIQHEMDHLYGRLIIDYASSIRRDIYTRKARKAKEERG